MWAQTPNVLYQFACAMHGDVCRSCNRRHVSCTRLNFMSKFFVVMLDRYTGYEDGCLSKHTFLQHEEGFDPFTGQKGWKRLKKALSQDRRWSGVATPSYSPDGLYVAALVNFILQVIIYLQPFNAQYRSWGVTSMFCNRGHWLLNTADTLAAMWIVCACAAAILWSLVHRTV